MVDIGALARKAELAAKYSTDDAFGVCLVRYGYEDEDAQRGGIPEGEIDWGDGDYCSVIPGYGSATQCTQYARFIVDREGGDVVGVAYSPDDLTHRPVPELATFTYGHDWALVDGRFIVDPWPSLVECVGEMIVLDIEDPNDAPAVARFYGDPMRWVWTMQGRNARVYATRDEIPDQLRRAVDKRRG